MVFGISGKISSGKDEVGKIIQNLLGNDWEIKKYADKLKDIVCLLIGCTREQLEDREFKEKELGEEWISYRLIVEVGDEDDTYLFNSKEEALKFLNKNYSLYPNRKSNKYITYWSYQLNEERLTPRKLLQLLGTEAGRQIIHPNIWVNALMSEYKKLPVNPHTGGMQVNHLNRQFPNWIITDMRFPNEVEAVKSRGGITIRINRPETDHLAGGHASETALDKAEFDYVIDNVGTLEELIYKVEQILRNENLL